MSSTPMHEVKSAAAILAEDVICQSFIQSSSTLAYACLLIRRGKYDLALHVLHSLEAKQASRFKDMVFYLQAQIGIETGEYAAVKKRLVPRVHQHPNDMVALGLLESCIYLEFEIWEKNGGVAAAPAQPASVAVAEAVRAFSPDSPSHSGTPVPGEEDPFADRFPAEEQSALPSSRAAQDAVFAPVPSEFTAREPQPDSLFAASALEPSAFASAAPPHAAPASASVPADAGSGLIEIKMNPSAAEPDESVFSMPLAPIGSSPSAPRMSVPSPSTAKPLAKEPAAASQVLSPMASAPAKAAASPAAKPAAPAPKAALATAKAPAEPRVNYTASGDGDFGVYQTLVNDANTQGLAVWNSDGRFRATCRNPALEPLTKMLPYELPGTLKAACADLEVGDIRKICFSFQQLTVTTLHSGAEHMALLTGNINQSLLSMVRAENVFLKAAASANTAAVGARAE